MAFAGGWICRSCWSSNRGRDTRCYRCKTERTAEDQTVTLGGGARDAHEAALMVRQARVPALVGLWPSVIFRIYAWLTFIVGVLLAIFTVILAMQAPRDQSPLPMAVGLTVMCFLLWFAYRWVSRGMLRSSPWAFGIGLLLLGGEAILILYAISIGPAAISGSWTTYADIVIFGSGALLALIGLLYSLRGDDEASRSATEAEPG